MTAAASGPRSPCSARSCLRALSALLHEAVERRFRSLWKWHPEIPQNVRVPCGSIHRSVGPETPLTFVSTVCPELVETGSSATLSNRPARPLHGALRIAYRIVLHQRLDRGEDFSVFFFHTLAPGSDAANPIDLDVLLEQVLPPSQRALDTTERERVLSALHCERFVDKAPAQVWATLLDEGIYHCSIRTMYRILSEHGEVRERRNQLRHPNYQKPELVAEAPIQVWSWDITKLRGPVKWTYFYLYVILDIFSRYVTGWMLARRESAELARRLISESCLKNNIDRRPAHHPRRPRQLDAQQVRRLAPGRPRHNQDALAAVRLER